MTLAILRLLAAGIWVAASVYIVATGPEDESALRYAAAALVAAPAAATFAWGLGDLFGALPRKTRRKVKWALKSALIDLHRHGHYRDDITRVSFHVWVLPLWYRKLPSTLRGDSKSTGGRLSTRFRPRLKRIAMYRFEHQGPSRIKFRPGVGLVGRSIELNNRSKAQIVRFNRPDFQKALKSEGRWVDSKNVKITQNLTRDQALELSKSYSQAAAHVLQEAGNPIGCVSMSLPPNCSAEFTDTLNDPLLLVLKATTESIENLLTSRS